MPIFEDVGRSVCIALLEWAGCNPVSRMATSHYKNSASVVKVLIVQNSLLPYDQLKSVKLEVQREKEQMKAKQHTLTADLLRRQMLDERKAHK